MTKGWKTYWIAVGVISVVLFAWILVNGWFELVPAYSKGHGPDPGSQEALRGAARRQQDTPFIAALAAVHWLAFSAVIAGIVIGARNAFRWLGAQNKNVR